MSCGCEQRRKTIEKYARMASERIKKSFGVKKPEASNTGSGGADTRNAKADVGSDEL